MASTYAAQNNGTVIGADTGSAANIVHNAVELACEKNPRLGLEPYYQMKAAATILAERLQTVFVVIEYNWKRVGGAFSTREEAEKWVSHASDIQVNLEWEIHEFKRGCGLTDAEVIAEYEDR